MRDLARSSWSAVGPLWEQLSRQKLLVPEITRRFFNRAVAKLHARDRAQLVVLAHESGLVVPSGR